MTTDLYHLHFFLVFIYLYLLETLIFWTKCYLATPYLKAGVWDADIEKASDSPNTTR